MNRPRIDYSRDENCFLRIKDVPSELVWGDLTYVKEPWLSYVVPVFKRADLLKETLQSIFWQKPVNFDWDIVVVDNEAGEENDTERLIREINNPRILYYRNRQNLGPDGNYNRCIELGRGKWLAMLHADDLIIRDHLRFMGHYIREHERDRRPLAYISPQYVEFSDSNKLERQRRKAEKKKKEAKRKAREEARKKAEKAGRIWKEKEEGKEKVCYGKLWRFRQINGLFSGYSVGLPSFGTVMNKEIMLKTGGFNEDFGTCEDVIIPYKLAQNYGVYTTPYTMGFYRFDGNESMKPETVFKIYRSMVDFREFMYSQNAFTRWWGNLARDELNRTLIEYCQGYSRFTKTKLRKEDFWAIYKPQRQSWLSLKLFQAMELTYLKIFHLDSFEKRAKKIMWSLKPLIEEMMEEKGLKKVIIYGAGKFGKIACRFIRRRIRDLHVVCFAVTNPEENDRKVMGLEVKPIAVLTRYREKALVLVATVIPEYGDEMWDILKKLKFKNLIQTEGEKNEIL